jgi:AmpD protein
LGFKFLSSEPATLSFIPDTGWLADIRHVHSPNYDERPSGCCPELIIVHGISLPPCEFGGPGIDQLFTNCLNPDEHPYYAEIAGLEVSSHFLIRRDGELVQYVDIFKRAWHAGKSSYQGRERCNDFAIGIELEGADDVAYEPAQYEMLAGLVRILRNSLPTLEVAPLVGHSDVAPGRKTDPGPAFSWTMLERLLY